MSANLDKLTAGMVVDAVPGETPSTLASDRIALVAKRVPKTEVARKDDVSPDVRLSVDSGGDVGVVTYVENPYPDDKVATLVKRALQFGTRIAPFSNRLCFGSNRKDHAPS